MKGFPVKIELIAFFKISKINQILYIFGLTNLKNGIPISIIYTKTKHSIGYFTNLIPKNTEFYIIILFKFNLPSLPTHPSLLKGASVYVPYKLPYKTESL